MYDTGARPNLLRRVVSSPFLLVVALAALIQGTLAWVNQGIPILYPFIREELGLSLAQVGMITAVLSGGGMVTSLLGGWLTDVWGAKRTAATALVLLGLVVIGFAVTKSFWVFLLLGAVAGMAEAPVSPAASRMILDRVPRKTRGLAMGIKQMGPSITGVVTAVVLPILAVNYGWRTSLMMPVIAIFASAALFFAFYRERTREGGLLARPPLFRGVLGLTQDPRLVGVTLWSMVNAAVNVAVGSYLVLFMVDHIHLTPVVAGGYLALARLSSSGGRLFWGAFSDVAFGGRRVIVLGVMGSGTALALLGASAANENTPSALVLVLVLVLGATAMSWHGVFHVVVGETAKEGQQGMALGAASTISRIGAVFGPPLFGLLVDTTGSYSVGWITVAGMALFSSLALVIFAGGQRPEAPS